LEYNHVVRRLDGGIVWEEPPESHGHVGGESLRIDAALGT